MLFNFSYLSSKQKKDLNTESWFKYSTVESFGSHKFLFLLYQARGIIFSSNLAYLFDHMLQMEISTLFQKFSLPGNYLSVLLRCFIFYSINIYSLYQIKSSVKKLLFFFFHFSQTPFNLLGRNLCLSLALTIKQTWNLKNCI